MCLFRKKSHTYGTQFISGSKSYLDLVVIAISDSEKKDCQGLSNSKDICLTYPQAILHCAVKAMVHVPKVALKE